MPKRDPSSGWQPKYRKHKSGQARVVIDGVTHWLGQHGSPESLTKYDRLIARWRAEGCSLPRPPGPGATVATLLRDFWAWAWTEYRKHDRPTSEIDCYRSVIRVTSDLFAELDADDFGPEQLREVRAGFLRQTYSRAPESRKPGKQYKPPRPWSRGYVNEQVNRVRRIWSWGVEHGYAREGTWAALQHVRPLRRGKTAAPEGRTVSAVSWSVVEATLPHIRSERLRAMIQVHRLLGCRVEEITIMRPGDLDRTADPEGVCWRYTPGSFKTEHLEGKPVCYWPGPAAQAILLPLLEGLSPDEYVFGHPPAHVRTGKRRAHFTKDTYARSVKIACERGGLPHWSPGQIRHLRATEIRAREYRAGRRGAEGSQSVLNHSEPTTTEIYAERDEIARSIQREIG